MAGTIATVNTSDKTVIVSTREAFLRQTNLGSSWTNVRIGMFYTWVPSGNDDAASVDETVTRSAFRDDFRFGLKDSSNIGPQDTGSQFIGALQNGTLRITTNTAGGAEFGGNSGGTRKRFATTNGTSELAGAYSPNDAAGFQYAQYSASTVNSFLALRLVVASPGTGSQTVTISYSSQATAISDVTKENLRYLLLSSSYSTTEQTACTWNSAGSALPLLDYFYVQCPYSNNRLRITTYGVVSITA